MLSVDRKKRIPILVPVCLGVIATACGPQNPPQAPVVTSIGRSIVTLQKASPLANCDPNGMPTLPPPASSAPEDQLDPQPWWAGLPPNNKQYGYVGWTAFQPGPGGCAGVRTDSYRAVAVFNLTPASNLRGLVKHADLVVTVKALPSATRPGGVITAGPLGQPGSVTLFCPTDIGGAASLVRFGPNAPLPPVSSGGSFEMLGANPFPSGTSTVYTLPQTVVPNQSLAGPIANAATPSTISYISGIGSGISITTDVTAQVTAALNGNFSTMAWMLTSNFEGSLPFAFGSAATFNCRAAYDFDLRITQF